MKSVLRMRHYCDFCRKQGAKKPAIAKHESRCTANPNRVCGMCQIMGVEQLTMDQLQEAYAKGFKALLEAANNCPACVLAADRQYFASLDPEDYSWADKHCTELAVGWDFKTACKEFWETWGNAREPY